MKSWRDALLSSKLTVHLCFNCLTQSLPRGGPASNSSCSTSVSGENSRGVLEPLRTPTLEADDNSALLETGFWTGAEGLERSPGSARAPMKR